MEGIILFLSTLIVSVIQVSIPFLVKRTVVFGVTVPMEHTNHAVIKRSKKLYSIITGVLVLGVLITFLVWSMRTTPTDVQMALMGLMLPLLVIVTSLVLYFYFHIKISKLKKEQRWFEGKKQVKISDLNIRAKDEMLPWYVVSLPILLTIGLMVFTVANYSQFPDQIPVHWGADGKPDAYTDKSALSVLSLPLILLVLQGMFLGIIELTKRSGFKIRPTNTQASKKRQMNLRKYTSWLLLLVSLLLTMLFSFLQVMTLYGNMFSDMMVMLVPLIFMFLTLAGAVVFAIKVGKVDSDLDEVVVTDQDDKVEEYDEDRYWIGGMIYFNKQDPSVLVEKRFGIGMTVNFARPMAYMVLVVPILLILLLSFL
ncbi:DUF1648 domain-containing protein [Pontibacillus salipaludis]|uniref:Membrane protein n=1 Tax=Pontibacillus salipaludis TaxID=1697394 RepID=A0ABQ1QDB3_9BACI|nr:DUF1648 domain-containing protein [Pontibacillus salipaludis]GGD22636.1 membrane protein [Pontibacillus salipaludis]